MKILDGKLVAQSMVNLLKVRITNHQKLGYRPPRLDIISLSDDSASEVYLNQKTKKAKECGISTVVHKISSTLGQAQAEECVKAIALSKAVDGVIIQLPVYDVYDARRLINKVSPEKDVDGLTIENQGRVMLGISGHKPCTPAGVLQLLDYYQIPTRRKIVTIIGRSELVGKPLAAMLSSKGRDATVRLCHSWTDDLISECNEADILISAVGMPKLIRYEMVKADAVVIDVGINRVDGKICGDVDFEDVRPITSAITPVPGGVGPLTVAQLMSNVVDAWENLCTLS